MNGTHGAALKRRIGRLWAILQAHAAERRIILVYHSVGGGTESTAVNVFHDHVALAVDRARLVPLPNLLAAHAAPGVTVAITFDDGYATLRDRAAPILAEFGAAATAFLNVGEIGERERRTSRPENGYYPGELFLSWRDADALLTAGWLIGSHGMAHLDLRRVSPTTAHRELTASKAEIERRFGVECGMFAYPWGRHHPGLRAQVRAAGYRYGFAGDHSPLAARADPFALPRINVAKEYTRDDLAAILCGDWDYLYWLGRAKAAAG